jgi:type IV secretory pathway VirB9-like protein
MLCTLDFAPGEQLGDFYVSDPTRWRIQPAMTGSATPELVAQAQTPGLRANMVVFSKNTNHVYRIMLSSVADPRPLYASFVFPAPPQAPSKPKPRPVPPLTLSQIVDKACRTQTWRYTADGATDRKGHVDPVLASMRPVRICGDGRRTYLQMPSSPVAVSDLPTVFEDTASGETQANYHYAERDRIFTVNSSADVVLKLTLGKRTALMHIRRAT